ncbi:CsbA family protein [Indiicoccus explosivorum]|uniref:CsbA family protein n=1 Tax=Indiicoccus explosivorum TaxID=1917864 RepID=UPI000B4311C0|nr:CsbA family protein [Indiicoccus explosivorum]
MESMVTKFFMSLFIPGLLVILFTRVTYHHVVGLVLTVSLIAAAVYAGYTHTWLLFAVNAFSLTAGFSYASYMVRHARKADLQD